MQTDTLSSREMQSLQISLYLFHIQYIMTNI